MVKPSVNSWFVWLFLIFTTASVVIPHKLYAASTADINTMRDKALAYLFLNQDADGYWDGPGKTDIQATSLVLQAFHTAGIKQGSSVSASLSWLANAHPLSMPALGSQASALGQAGYDVTDQLARLLASQSYARPAWGSYPHYHASFPDTPIVTDAWFLSGVTYPGAASTLGYLTASVANSGPMNPDGGWPYVAPNFAGTVIASASHVIPTARTVLTLSRYRTLGWSIDSEITAGINWLLLKQLVDGGLSDDDTESVGEPYETALVLSAIKAAQIVGNSAAVSATTTVDSAIDFLVGQQSANGSWGDDLIATASVVDALASVVLTDGDNDGIPDNVELLTNTDPLVADASSLLNGIGDAIAGLHTATVLIAAQGGVELTAWLPAPASGSVVSYHILSGTLPSGLSLDSPTGALTGVPDVQGAFPVEYVVNLADGSTESGVITLEINGFFEAQVPMLNLGFLSIMALMLVVSARYRRVKPYVSSLAIVCLLFSVVPILVAPVNAQTHMPAQTAQQITDAFIGKPENRDETVRSIEGHVDHLSLALAEYHSDDARKMFAKAHRTAIAALNQRLNEELKGVRSRYRQNAASPLTLTSEQMATKEASMQALFSEVDSLQSLDGDEVLDAFLSLRKRLSSYNPHHLPDRAVPTWTHLGDTGVAIDLEPSQSIPAYLAADYAERAKGMYAFNGNVLLLAGAPSTPAEALTCSYSAADLADDGQDVTITQEIQDLAESLEYAPARLLEYVANEIEFEPYYGALKGAEGTLKSGSGSATDQSSLLIALLRASNIPARYVRGSVRSQIASNPEDVPVNKWLQVKSSVAAAQRLSSGQNPQAASGTAGAEILGFSHVWVEACVPYAHYQGARFDNKGHRWVPLDASFETRRFEAGITTSENFDFDGYLDGFKDKMPNEHFSQQVNSAVTGASHSVSDVGYQSEKQTLELDILPSSLPYAMEEFTDWSNSGSPETAVLPDSHRYFLHVETLNSADVSLGASTSQRMSDIVLNRITLAYDGATAGDQTAIHNWRLNGGTLPDNINLVPVIRIDGNVVDTGTVSVLSQTKTNKVRMWISFEEARAFTVGADNTNPAFIDQGKSACITGVGDQKIINEACFDTISAANYHVLQAYAYQGSERVLNEVAARVVAAVNNESQLADALDETLGDFLYYMALKYMQDISDASKEIGQLTGQTGDSGLHLGLTGSKSQVDKVLDLPFGVLKRGFYVDVPGGRALSRDIVSGELNFDSFVHTGYAASAYESFIWQENARLDAVSTIRGIQFAKEQGFDLLTISSANQATELPKLIAEDNSNFGPEAYQLGFIQYLKDTYLSNGVDDQGFTIKIPDRQIDFEGWKGNILVATRFIVDNDPSQPGNQASASAGFPISGGFAGGYTVSDPTSYLFDSFNDTSYGWVGSSPTSFGSGSISGSLPSISTPPININNAAIGTGLTPFITSAGDPVNLVNGNFYHSERDLVIPYRDLPFVFERFYNGRDAQDGPLGFGWTHSFNHFLRFIDENPDGQESADDMDGITSQVSWVDGTRSEKRLTVSAANSSGVTASSVYTNGDGQYFSFVRETNGSFTVTEKNGLIYRFEANAGDVEGIAKLTQIESRNGNTLTLSYNGNELDKVTDSTGRFIDFTYTSGKISRVEDWTGRAHEYGYINGNLVSYKNPLALANEQAPVVYDYFTAADSPVIDHAIKSITLPKGNGMTFEYYVDGRVFRHTNTAGETFTFQYNDFRRETVVTDARGFSKQYFFNEYGNPVEIIDEEGGIATYEYTDPDDPYLRTKTVNEARLRTEYEYNANGTLVLQRNPSNSTIVYSDFTAFEQPGKIKDANGNYRLLKYDVSGNVSDEIFLKLGIGAATVPSSYIPQQSDLLGWVKHTYDSAGNRTSSTQVRDVPTSEGFKQEWTFDASQLYATQIERCGDKNGDGVIDGTNDPCDIAALTHDSLGRLTAGVNGRFEPVDYRYDELNRLVRGTDAIGNIRDYGFDDNGNADYQGLSMQKQIGQGFINRSLDPLTGGMAEKLELIDSSSSHFDESDRQRIALDAAGNATYFSYDPMGNIETVTNPDNYNIRFVYDGLGRVVSAFDEEGREAKRDIDPIGRMRSLTDPNGNAETFSYYDAANDGRLEKQCETAATSSSIARCTTFIYDDNGNVTVLTDNAGNLTQSDYDALNRPVRIVEPVYTDPVHGSVRPVTRYTYTLLGQISQVEAGYTDMLGLVTSDVITPQQSSVYDDWGRKLSDADQLGQIFEYRYDFHGDLIQQIVPTIAISSTNPTVGNDVLSTTTINRSYGVGGVLLTQGSISYDRNVLGQVTKVTGRLSNNGDKHYSNNYSYSYDAAHRLRSAVGGGVSFSYVLSPGGLLERVDVTRGSVKDTINYRYDQTGRLQSISNNDTEHVSYVFDDGGRLKQKVYPGGVSAQYGYFDDNRLKQLLVKGPTSTTLLQQDFTYDTLGRRDGLTENLNGTATNSSYAYDNLSRLTSETLGAQTQSFTYDQFGNRVTHTKFDGSTEFYEHNAAHQLHTVRENNAAGLVKARYQHTPAGELYRGCEGASAPNVTDETLIRGECDLREYKFFQYNTLGQMDLSGHYTNTDGATHTLFDTNTPAPDLEQVNTEYRYDYQGNRMQVSGFNRFSIIDNGSGALIWTDVNKDPHNTQYRYQGEAIYLSYQTGGSTANPEARWMQGGGTDEPLARYGNDSSVTNYHQDGRNSAVLTTNAATGAVVASQQFDAFGNVSQSTGTIAQYGYTGREPSADGLMYYRARYYDPSHGRFTSRDPKGFIDGINMYAYTRNNPVNRIDPRGTVSIGTNNYNSLNTNYFSGGGSSSQTLASTNNNIDIGGMSQTSNSLGFNLPSLPRASGDSFGGFLYNRLIDGGVRDDLNDAFSKVSVASAALSVSALASGNVPAYAALQVTSLISGVGALATGFNETTLAGVGTDAAAARISFTLGVTSTPFGRATLATFESISAVSSYLFLEASKNE